MFAVNRFSILSISALALSALAILLFDSPAVVLLACLCGTAVGVLLFYLMFVGRRPARLTEIMAASLLTGYCTGCAITQSFCGLDQHGIGNTNWAIVPPAWVSFTMVVALAACTILIIAGWFESSMFVPSDVIVVGRPEEWLIWIGMVLIVVEVALGRFGYEGQTVEQGTGRVNVLTDMAGSYLGMALLLAAIGWMQSSGFRRLRFAVITLAALMLIVPTGRRSLVYSVMSAVFAATRLSGGRITLRRQTKWVWGIASVIMLLGASVVFLALRMASDALGPGDHPLSQIVEKSGSIFENSSELLGATEQNLETRPFLLTQYLSLLTKGGNTPPPMYGADLNLSVGMMIPDSLYRLVGRSKNDLRQIGTEENLANEHFHLPVFDDANSILTAGVIDFGLIGIVIYPIGMCLLWRLFGVGIERILGRKARVLFLLMALGIFLQAEVQISGYLVSLRGALIILITWMALNVISRGLTLRGSPAASLRKRPDAANLSLTHGIR